MKKVFFIVICSIMFTSCATITSGPSQKIKITSKSNKQIQIINEQGVVVASGNGKIETRLQRSSKYFTGAYYKIKTNNETITIYPQVNILKFAIGNFFISGSLGYLIDGLTGSMYDLATDDYYDLSNLEIK